MRLSEFKAFLEGLEHGFRGGAPSPEQWELIKDKMHQVRGETSPVVTRDRSILDDLVYRGPEIQPQYVGEPLPTSPPFWPQSEILAKDSA